MSEENANADVVPGEPVPVVNVESMPAESAPSVEPAPAEPEGDEPAPAAPGYKADDYGFGEVEPAGPQEGDEPQDGDEAAGYEVEWPEGYEANDELTGMVNAAARECGVQDRALGAYTARMIELLEAKHAERLAADDAALKEAWGSDFLSNKKEAQAFMGRMMKATGLTKDDLSDFANPRGFKVLHALSRQMGGGRPQGLERKANTAELDWAKAAMGDRSHADFKALNDPRDPRHREVTARYFRAMGAKV